MLNFECLCSFHVYMHPCWLERLLCCERCFFSALRGLALLNSIFIGVSFGILIEGRKWRELLGKNVTQLSKQSVKKGFGSDLQVICLNKIKLYIYTTFRWYSSAYQNTHIIQRSFWWRSSTPTWTKRWHIGRHELNPFHWNLRIR